MDAAPLGCRAGRAVAGGSWGARPHLARPESPERGPWKAIPEGGFDMFPARSGRHRVVAVLQQRWPFSSGEGGQALSGSG
jgi:hypothetical protein